MENPETNYAIAPDGVYLAYQTLGTGSPRHRLAAGLAGEHRLRMGCVVQRHVLPAGARVLHSGDHARPTRYRAVEPTRRASRSGDQSRRICGSCSMPPVRIAWSCAVSTTREASTRCSRRRTRSGCIRSCGSSPGRVPRRHPTTPGVPRLSTAKRRMRNSSLWGTSAYGLAHIEHETAFGNAAAHGVRGARIQAEPQCMHARCRQTDVGELVRDRCAGGPAGGQMSDAPAAQDRLRATRKPRTSPR